MMYATLVIMIAVALVGGAAALAYFKLNTDDLNHLKKLMKTGMNNYGEDDHEGVTLSWDAIQGEFKCCGVSGYEDWKKTPFGGNGKVPQNKWKVPDSCCREETENCGNGFDKRDPTKDIFTDGCWTTIEEAIDSNSKMALGIGIGVVVVLIIVAVAACRVAKKGYN